MTANSTRRSRALASWVALCATGVVVRSIACAVGVVTYFDDFSRSKLDHFDSVGQGFQAVAGDRGRIGIEVEARQVLP